MMRQIDSGILVLLLIVLATTTSARAMEPASGSLISVASLPATTKLEEEFASTPDDANPRVYWWWPHSVISRHVITWYRGGWS